MRTYINLQAVLVEIGELTQENTFSSECLLAVESAQLSPLAAQRSTFSRRKVFRCFYGRWTQARGRLNDVGLLYVQERIIFNRRDLAFSPKPAREKLSHICIYLYVLLKLKFIYCLASILYPKYTHNKPF